MDKNFLVVEDNEVNLELITLLIRQYGEEKNIPFNVFTARNGEEAVEACQSQVMDIVFMDVMMPVMNGSDATRIIKSRYPKTMVIVISTFGDEGKQKELLQNGAEDYMIKPINAPLFKNRLSHYLQLLEHRNYINRVPRAKNLFTSKVYSYSMHFTISNDAELSEFWEAMLIRLDYQRHIDNLSDFIRFIYRIGSLQLQHGFQFNIHVEENEESFFFTIDNIQLIGCQKLHRLIEHYYNKTLYLCKENLLTFALQKKPIETVAEATGLTEEERAVPVQAALEAPATTEAAPAIIQQTEQLMTFDILDADDLEDFERHLMELRSTILLMENSTIEPSDIDEISICLNEMASIISISNDTYVLSHALHELSDSITQNASHFEAHSAQLFDFVNAFVNDLVFWKTKIFYDGAPSVDFLNDSITTNANMLTALLQPESSDDADLDDIFDF